MKRTARSSATAMLKTQHRRVKTILGKLEGGRGDAEAQLVELASNLAAHMKIEQDLLYPAARRVDKTLLREAFEEHAIAELALKRLLETETDDPTFRAKATVLKELIEHHVKEEENALFPKLNKKLGADEQRSLRAQMKALFDETLALGYAATLPKSGTSADLAQRRVLRGSQR